MGDPNFLNRPQFGPRRPEFFTNSYQGPHEHPEMPPQSRDAKPKRRKSRKARRPTDRSRGYQPTSKKHVGPNLTAKTPPEPVHKIEDILTNGLLWEQDPNKGTWIKYRMHKGCDLTIAMRNFYATRNQPLTAEDQKYLIHIWKLLCQISHSIKPSQSFTSLEHIDEVELRLNHMDPTQEPTIFLAVMTTEGYIQVITRRTFVMDMKRAENMQGFDTYVPCQEDGLVIKHISNIRGNANCEEPRFKWDRKPTVLQELNLVL